MAIGLDLPRAQAPRDAPKQPRRRRLPRISRKAIPYLFLVPAVVAELLVHIIPIVVGLAMSFLDVGLSTLTDWTVAPFVGLGNYGAAVHFDVGVGKDLIQSFGVSVAYTVLVVGFSWLLGFSAAVLLQSQRRGRGTLRAMFLIPYAMPAFTAVITWGFMFQRDGLVNQFLANVLHVVPDPGPFWLLDPHAFWSMTVVSIWRNWPFAFLILMAGLQTVPGDLYEAAAIDGAGAWQQIRRITAPMLRPVTQALLVVLFLWNFNDFNTPFVLFGKSPPSGANLISIDIYTNTFSNWQLGEGSAQSVLMLLFLGVVVSVYLWLTSRRGKNAV
jgi:multiple sugar transport system permease protein